MPVDDFDRRLKICLTVTARNTGRLVIEYPREAEYQERIRVALARLFYPSRKPIVRRKKRNYKSNKSK